MKTILKMLATVVVGTAFFVWHLSDHPRPLSNGDSIFLLASAFVITLVVFLFWKIDAQQEDIKDLKRELGSKTGKQGSA